MNGSLDELLLFRTLGVPGIPRKAPRIIPVTWRPPSVDWVKVNTDGSALGAPGPSGAGGIFRNARGFSKGCFAFSTGEAFAFVAELQAAMFAVTMASERGWSHVWLESDSTYVVNLFKTRSTEVPWSCRVQWAACLRLLQNMSLVVSHIYREGNQVADALANHGARHSGLQWWPSYPDFCSSFVYDDFASKECYRFA